MDTDFRPASTCLDNALVACGLTQILAEGSSCRWGAVGIPDHIHGEAMSFYINGPMGQATGNTNVWSRPIEVGRNVAICLKLRSKVS